MELSAIYDDNLASIKNAAAMLMLRNAMNMNSGTVNLLLEGMEETSGKAMENSVSPHLGTNVDINV